MISRRLDCDYINLGFSGYARWERILAEYIGGLAMKAFVYDYDHNAPTLEHLEKTHQPMFEVILSLIHIYRFFLKWRASLRRSGFRTGGLFSAFAAFPPQHPPNFCDSPMCFLLSKIQDYCCSMRTAGRATVRGVHAAAAHEKLSF